MRNRFRFKLLGVTLSLLLIFALVGCGGNQSTKPPAATGDKAPGSGEKKDVTTVSNAPMKLTLAGGSAGGFWTAIGEAVGQQIRKAYPGSSFTYEQGSGLGNMKLIKDNQVELGLVQNIEVLAGEKGLPPLKEKITGLMAVGTVYDNAPMQFFVRKEFVDKYGIKSFKDIAAKKPPIVVAVNQKGNLSEAMNRDTFAKYGFTYDDIKKWGGDVLYVPMPKGFDLMKDRRADLNGAPVHAPSAAAIEAAVSTNMVLLPVDDDAVAAMGKDWGTRPYTIPAGTYKFNAQDVKTLAVGAMVMIGSKVSNEDAYKIAKAMVENIDILKSTNPALKDFTPEKMANTAPLPLHPGAAKYYKEKGLIK